jgi:EAL domain-containing protein (putative c-di-GMP-specific phosphodiesterase class I)
VSTVNAIGRIMGIVTIAEEVENETILEKLRAGGAR